MIKKNVLIPLFLLFILLFIIFSLYYLFNLNPKMKTDIITDKRTETGIIKEITNSGDYGTIYIERDVYKAYVIINQSTTIMRENSTENLAFKDLNISDNVKVTVPEIILEIYPYKYATERIIIIE